jgi:hypothetical protein
MGKVAFIVVLLFVLIMMADRSVGKQEESGGGKEMGDKKQLEAGDMAPVFRLKSIDGKEETDLEEFRGRQPVVLFFGSYT